MKVVGLISGGKDSCYNLMKCVENGNEIVALINLYPADETRDELDSYMYQTVGHQLIQYYSDAIGLPLFRRAIKGRPINIELEYDENKLSLEGETDHRPIDEHDEVEDLFEILKEVKQKIDFQAVSVGAIFSSYQNNRVLNVCKRLDLKVLAYLWQMDQKQLLDNMIKDGLEAILIKVAAIGLVPEQHLGKNLKEMQSKLIELESKYGINVCGEGGEFETFTLDCPLFRKRIVIDDTQTIIHSNDAFAKVGFLRINKLKLVDK